MSHLATKTSVVAFVRPVVTQSILEDFQSGVAKGREWHDVFDVCPTRSFGDLSIDQLEDLCVQHFSSEQTPFHPLFFIILEERSNLDGSVHLYHYGDSGGNRMPRQELRVSPASLSALLTLLNVGMRTIPDILSNDCPDDPTEAEDWFYDVPVDHSRTQQTARVPLSSFTVKDGPLPEFHTLELDAGSVSELGFPAVNVRLFWFGEPPESLLLHCCWSKRKPTEKHVTGEYFD